MGKKQKRPSLLSKITFKVIRFFGRLFYKKTDIVGMEKLAGRDIIIVANHAQLHGPIGELFMPENVYTWANGQMARWRIFFFINPRLCDRYLCLPHLDLHRFCPA